MRACASTRWSSLSLSRIGDISGLVDHLGQKFFEEFLAEAGSNHKAAFTAAFCVDTLCCVGPVGNGVCPHNYTVDLLAFKDEEDLRTLVAGLHTDHSRVTLTSIMTLWVNDFPKPTERWSDGVNGDLICHLLYGFNDHPNAALEQTPRAKVLWKANLELRCGINNKLKKQPESTCHRQCGIDNAFTLVKEDIMSK